MLKQAIIMKNIPITLGILLIFYSILVADWDIVEIGPTWMPGNIAFFNEDTGFSGLLRTTDGGITWDDSWIIPPFGQTYKLQMVSSREGWLVFQPIGVTRPRHNLATTTDCGDS